MLKVENLISRNGNKVPNQFIIDNGIEVVFQSYDSLIVSINYHPEKIVILINQNYYDYSNTTIKYRNIFFETVGYSQVSSTKNLEKALKQGFFYTDGGIKIYVQFN